MSIYINDNLLEDRRFLCGEHYVKIPTIWVTDHVKILAYLQDADSIVMLLLVVDAVRRINLKTTITLVIPYIPYARQDKVYTEGESLSVAVIANLINSLNCESVVLYDPHSDLTLNLIKRCEIVSLHDIILKSPIAKKIVDENLILVSPDKGAKNKIINLAGALKISPTNILYASKFRDPIKKNIIDFKIDGEVNGENFILLDDICDAGNTFIQLSKMLRKFNAKKIYLYATHAILSKGLGDIKEHFEHMYCYHTFLNLNDSNKNFLTCFSNFKVGCS